MTGPNTTASHTPPPDPNKDQTKPTKDYPELIWDLFGAGGVWVTVVLGSMIGVLDRSGPSAELRRRVLGLLTSLLAFCNFVFW